MLGVDVMAIFSRIKESFLETFVGRLFKSMMVRQVAWAVLIFLVITFVLSTNFMVNKIDLKVGEVSPRDVKAPKTVVDKAKTEELKRKVANSVPKAYDLKVAITDEVENKIVMLFNEIRSLQLNKAMDLNQKVAALKTNTGIELSEENARYLLRAEEDSLKQLEIDARLLVRQAMQNGIKEEDIEYARQSLEGKANGIVSKAEYVPVVTEIGQKVIKPNLIYNDAETQERREKVVNAVEDVKILKNQVIIRKGELVTQEHIEMLEALDLQHRRIDFSAMLGTSLLSLISLLLIIVYLYQFQREMLHKEKHIILLGILMLSVVLLAKAVGNFGGYTVVIPVVAGVMLIAILLDRYLAILLSIVLSMLVASIAGNELRYMIVAFITGIIAVYSSVKVNQRIDIARAGFILSLASALVIIAVGLTGDKEIYDVLLESVWGIIIGILSAVLTIGFLPYLENTFGITTSMKLLELSNPNQELLKRLLMEAPGTYHHSIIVGNMAEAAAEAVGADQLLTRVGAYYHDIGKIKRPYFYIENQLTKENPHEKMNPTLSAMIINLHVKDGVETAKKHKLPQPIIDIIEQHHGTSLISFFYYQALELGKNDSVDEGKFRYAGPKPQTKEAAIVMLADSIEAAVRSLSKPVPGRIEKLVKKIIKDKLNDEQLDECDLTLRDLDEIGEAFVRILTGIFHSRIEYPDNPEEMFETINERNGADGAVDQQHAEQDSNQSATD